MRNIPGLLTGLLVAGLATLAPAHAAAVTINFDDAPAAELFATAVPLTTRYSALGVTFSGTGAVLQAETADFMVTGFSPANVLAYAQRVTIGMRLDDESSVSQASDRLTFSAPVSSVSFLTGSGISQGFLQVSAFAGATLVDSTMVNFNATASAIEALQRVTLRGAGITSVQYRINGATELEGFVVDNLEFNGANVPEPTMLLLVGAGLTAAFARRRRRA